MGLRLRKLAGHLTRWWYPRLSCCGRCERPWSICEGHSTTYTPGIGCFPLCEQCWAELTPKERMPHYLRLWQQWQGDAATVQEWRLIQAAVMAGK